MKIRMLVLFSILLFAGKVSAQERWIPVEYAFYSNVKEYLSTRFLPMRDGSVRFTVKGVLEGKTLMTRYRYVDCQQGVVRGHDDTVSQWKAFDRGDGGYSAIAIMVCRMIRDRGGIIASDDKNVVKKKVVRKKLKRKS